MHVKTVHVSTIHSLLLYLSTQHFPTYLLHGEYLMVEVALELLVGQVDAKLFETVHLKVLKAKDVQNAHSELVVVRVGL